MLKVFLFQMVDLILPVGTFKDGKGRDEFNDL
jgi:hypothetical protein